MGGEGERRANPLPGSGLLGNMQCAHAMSSCKRAAAVHAELAINVAFTAEVILTCIAAGGVVEYLRSPWNLFDLSMVLVGCALTSFKMILP